MKIEIKKPTDEEYAQARANKAVAYAPDIYPCKKCGWPVVSGYCCTTCDDSNSSSND